MEKLLASAFIRIDIEDFFTNVTAITEKLRVFFDLEAMQMVGAIKLLQDHREFMCETCTYLDFHLDFSGNLSYVGGNI